MSGRRPGLAHLAELVAEVLLGRAEGDATHPKPGSGRVRRGILSVSSQKPHSPVFGPQLFHRC